MRGYDAMLKKIEPSKIICFGTPFSEMDGNIITVDYKGVNLDEGKYFD